ncbi:exo-beta-1,3-glucanase [Fomitiporia mediterranea MF3/22]|uniref:exo-beta-1,3-glucanase n=1 Tax=Fomitiporia mediterranea (strain MF3/22) TaxID=694068 RepID=UPI0004407FA9|nr:exo-beta-1,3-glucanase [Fomitiporia mediterranea MF3/22]EJD05787.1 exo-beta-1,3-glucanase [Fomitiporia mediterranea MF3/22]
MASALGSTCSAPATVGTAGSNDPFWMQNIQHQGRAAFNSNPSDYQVFRNVKDFGAKGDGVTDDTAAINAAMSSGNRCGGGSGCQSTTTAPAIVYFPPGEYLVSQPIVAWYYTQMIGDARKPPTLIAAANFVGIAVIDADPYIDGGGGAQWYVNQNNFYRSVRNFVIDLTRMPATSSATGLHWQVSQATSLINVVVNMSTDPATAHQGIFMENGSGGFMGDIVFNGGKFGIWVGNQQFTVRNITVNNAQSAIFGLWNWGWTFQGVTINNCQVGFDLSTGGLDQGDQTIGAEAIIDAVVTNTPIFVRTSQPSNGHLAGSLVLNNIKLNNVPTAVGVVGGAVVLNGGTTTIANWVQGNVYSGASSSDRFVQASMAPPPKPASLLDSAGRIFGKTHPQYADFAVDQFVSIRSLGAKGDGSTDDTQAIKNAFAQFSGCKIIFFDHGTYLVTSTITIPAGTQIVGEAWSVIMGSGSAFEDMNNPQPVIKVGDTNSQGVVEITDMVFTTRGPAAGAIVIEWNVHDPAGQQGAAGMWDSHIRLAGALGTNLDGNSCANTSSTGSNCIAAFLSLHLTPSSSAYLEGTWVWLADHSLDPPFNELQAYSGRGIYSQSAGPVWMIGTAAEHHVLYQYNLAGAKNHYMGLIQTETPYFQPSPAPPAPFTSRSDFNDPVYTSSQQMAWAVKITNSQDILIFGAGLYSFFQHFNQVCLNSNDCQTQIFDIDSASTVSVYSLSTVASQFQLSVNQQGIVDQGANRNGLQSTMTVWTSS